MNEQGTITYILNYLPTPHSYPPEQSTSLCLINGIKDIQNYQSLYLQIGSEWGWHHQNNWSQTQWSEHLSCPNIQGWILLQANIPCGFFELRYHPDKSVEIYYFGLVKTLQGKGLGSRLLACAVDAAQTMTRHLIWLKTSSTDHPAALRLYLQGGFKVIRVVQNSLSLSEQGSGALIPCARENSHEKKRINIAEISPH